ncbi:MAG: GatB/YqeY domain-containing protein [Flavobacteriales bacterium]|nr:GatB/YqeY domain-containing protein [Flavobacteriales bacterium]
MSLGDKINADIKAAMLAKEQVRLNTLRAIKSALLLEATKDGSSEVSEEVGLKIMTKLHKQRKESAAIYMEQGREDLASEEIAQAEILETYLPKQLDEAQIIGVVVELIANTGASSMADMGKIMGMASSKMAGQADGKVISEIVRSLLS